MTGKLKSRFLGEVTWREAAEVMERTSTVILPVGTVEMHGPHMPLGCDSFIAEAFALRLAEEIDCLVAPMEWYSFIGATSKRPGGAGVSFTASIEFVKHVIRGLMASGFKKIILISVHSPNATALSVVTREIFEETSVPVVSINPHSMLSGEAVTSLIGSDDDPLIEATLLAGALKILGKEHLVNWESVEDAEFVPVEPESLRRIMKIGSVGYYFRSEMTHQPPRSGVDPDKGVRIIEQAVERCKDLGRDLDDYIAYLEIAGKAQER